MISRRRFLRSSATTVAVSATGMAIMATPSVAAIPADPLLALIRRYEAEERRFNATYHADDEAAFADLRHFNELTDELTNWTAPATTEASAIAALRLADKFLQHSCDAYEHAMIAAALGFLEGRA